MPKPEGRVLAHADILYGKHPKKPQRSEGPVRNGQAKQQPAPNKPVKSVKKPQSVDK